MKNKSLVHAAIVLGLIIFFCIPIFSKLFTGSELVAQSMGALLGAIVTAFITYFLLSGQSSAEEIKERNVKVFEKKAENFIGFIDLLWSTWSDFKLEPKEIEDIREYFYKKVYIYLNKNNLKAISILFAKLSKKEIIGKELNEIERAEARNCIFEIISILKSEIGLTQEFDVETLAEIDKVFNQAQETSELVAIESKITTSYGNDITFWHFCMYDDTKQREILNDKSLLFLGDGEGEGAGRTNLIKQISKNDILFVYSRGYGYVGIFEASDNGRAIPKGSNERVFMNLEEGSEGQVPVNQLLFLKNEDTIKRDVPRLKTIQRIYDISAINGLVEKLVAKGIEKNETIPERLIEIKNLASKKLVH